MVGALFVMVISPSQLSAAVAIPRSRFAKDTPQRPSSVVISISAGQVISGASLSVMVTSNEHSTKLSSSSVALKVTVVVPTGNTSPEAGPAICSILTSPELSANSGMSNSTAAPQIPGSFGVTIFSGHEIEGSSPSSTVTVKLHSAVFPELSVAVNVTVVSPIGN
ncbi:hypothetical protein C723_3622 [Christiangramia flava JLT2011]|nr:hypothetical protein C723_3622 [Christiangramia flava JLT2011]